MLLTISLLVVENLLLVSACDHDHDHGHIKRGSLRLHGDEDVQDHRHLEEDGDDEECGFEAPTEEEIEEENLKLSAWRSSRASFRGSYNIPVYFHIIQPSFSEMISDDRVDYYINYLNDAFSSNTPFTFSLADTTRTVNEKWSNKGYENSLAYKKKLKRGGRDVLNIYICNRLPKPSGGNLAGFAFLPTSKADPVNDGVVISRTSPNDSRRPNTLVHEVVSPALFGR